MVLLKKSLALALSILLPVGPAFAANGKGIPPLPPAGTLPASASQSPERGAPVVLAVAPSPAAQAAAQAALQGVPAAISRTLTPVAVKVELPEARLAKLTPAQRADASAMAVFMRERLFAWDKFTVALPATAFDGAKGGLISVGDLFQSPTSDEVGEIGRSDAGRGPRLTYEQRAEVRKTARFTVPSARYPGQSHVWQLGGFLQKGRDAISETQMRHEAGALDQVMVQVPNRISGKKAPSLRRAAVNLGAGVYETLSLLVGLPATRPAHTEAEIREKVAQGILKPFRELAAKGLFDGRLLDEKLTEKAAPRVSEARKKADAFIDAHEDELRAVIEKSVKDPQAVANAMAGLRNQTFYKELLADKALEALSPGLGKLLIENGQAKTLVYEARGAVARDVEAYEARTRAELTAENPVLSRLPAWLDEQVGLRVSRYAEVRERTVLESMPDILRRNGLTAQAQLLDGELYYRSGVEPLQRRVLENETAPKRAFEHTRRIWRASRWKIEATEGADGKTYYHAVKHSAYAVNTKSLVWRVQNGVLRAFTWGNNALFHILVSNIWNGPLGVKSLALLSPFESSVEVDRATGALVRVGETGTLVSRIRASWKSRRDILEDFKKDQDYGLLGKDVRRFFLFFTADLGRGVIVPAVVLVFQPLLTIVNLAFAALALATALLWAPAVSLLNWAFNAAIYDADKGAQRDSFLLPRGLLPLADRVAGNLAVGTAVQALFSAFLAVPAHLVWGLAQYVFALLRTAARETWDFLMRGVIGWRGRIPPRDYRFFVRRVSGPGLSAEHYFQVPSDLVLVALQAQLEDRGVQLYRHAATEATMIPSENHASVLTSIGEVIGSPDRRASPASLEIEAKQKQALESIEKAARERQDMLAGLMRMPARGHIKLAKADFELVLRKAVALTKGHFTAYFAAQGWNAARIQGFWKENGLTPDDWEGLAKAQLTAVFSERILTPLEESDKTLRIEVSAPGLRDYAAGLEKGILPEQLKDIVLTGGEKPSAVPAASPTTPDAASLVLSPLFPERE